MHQYRVHAYNEATTADLVDITVPALNWIEAHNRYCNLEAVVAARLAQQPVNITVTRLDRDDSKTIDFDFIVYDVWGNAEDSWEVNNKFRTSTVVKVPEWLFDQHTPQDDELFFNLLKEQIGFKDGATADYFEWEGEPDFTLYASRASDGYPEFELQNRKVYE